MNDQEFKDKLAAYAKAKQLEKQAQKIIKEIGPLVKVEIIERFGEKAKVHSPEIGIFTIKVAKTWTYSKMVKDAITSLKKLTDDEERTGVATYEPRYDLFYKTLKDNEEE